MPASPARDNGVLHGSSVAAFGGRYIAGLEEALRVFEIHEGQVGVLVFVTEALASAFVVPTPEDYRLLYTSLLEDFYGELLYQYILLYDTTFPMDVSVDETKINSLVGLRAAVEKMRSDWASFQGFMAEGLAAKLAKTRDEFVLRLENAGFGYLLNQQVRDAACKKAQ